MSIQISAIICTHNHSAYLKKAIQSLLNQTIPKDEYEILVVDNGSTDDTKAVTESFGKQSNIRYTFEPRVGLSIARNTGIEEAKGEIVGFMDDDAVADESWLEEIVNTFTRVIPTLGACGGKVKLFWEAPRPEWLGDSLLQLLGRFDYGDEAFFVKTPDKFLGGLNMAFRKDTFKAIGLFDTQLGRIGKKLLSDEEVEFFHRMLEKGLRIFYNPKIVVTHHVPASRLKKEFHYQRFYWEGRSSALVRSYISSRKEIYNPKEFLRTLCLFALVLGRELLYNLRALRSDKEEKMVKEKCRLNYFKGYRYQQLIGFVPKLRISDKN